VRRDGNARSKPGQGKKISEDDEKRAMEEVRR
jgi:hypothetical protein